MNSGISSISLAKVYETDFGRRKDDREFWMGILNQATQAKKGPIRVVEGAIGNGRIPRLIMAMGTQETPMPIREWVGFDLDPGMVERCKEVSPLWVRSYIGDLTNRASWTEARLYGPVDVAIIAYSSLYLVPHDKQFEAINAAVETLDAGKGTSVLVVEAFIPRWMTGNYHEMRICFDPDGGTEPWQRRTDYTVGGEHTHAIRYYGPIRSATKNEMEWRYYYKEDIYWKNPGDLYELVKMVCKNRTERVELVFPPVSAPGHVAVIAWL